MNFVNEYMYNETGLMDHEDSRGMNDMLTMSDTNLDTRGKGILDGDPHFCPTTRQPEVSASISGSTCRSPDNTKNNKEMTDGSADEPYLRLGPRLSDTIPFNDGSIAFGTIRLYERSDESSGTTITYMRGYLHDDIYPNIIIKNARSKKIIRLDGLSVGTKSNVTTLRVYVLPQDVDRSNRGSLKDFKKLVKYLLNYVDCSKEAWLGDGDPTDPVCPYPEPVYNREESLFYIFNTLHSPSPSLEKLSDDTYAFNAANDALSDTIVGIKTALYPHQKRSVAAMIQKEAMPAKVRDTRKVKMLDIYGNEFYIDHNDGSLFRSQPLYSEPRGGILAETMGYGKTLICLAIILATRGHYPSIPHYCIENHNEVLQPHVSSLLSMAARALKHKALPWKNEFYMMKKAGYHYDRCVEELKKHERSYNEPTAGTMNPTRKGKAEYTNTIQLCSATLVLVPPNLVIQWQQEIQKHVDPDAIDVLVVDSSSTSLPPWQELIKYDVVLMSKSRFEKEYRDDDLNQGRGSRFVEKYQSPLTQVRWLRVICDEGHSFAGSSSKTNAMAMLDKMYIERRWVVSGTPSSNLHGVDVGTIATMHETEAKAMNPFATTLEKRRRPSIQDSESKDLDRLRLIVVNFLKLQPWSNRKGEDTADWKTYLAPKVTPEGKRYSMPALREVMQTLIIRHRIQDLYCDLVLPLLHTRVVYLTPSYYDKISINLFIMVLISNYVTSEREDEDYMFHPRNRGKLTELINNLGHATFYWVGFTRQNVKDTLDVSSRYLDKHIDKVSDADGLLLTEAILNGERALQDSGWQAFSTLHEMGVYVKAFPDSARYAWALDGIDCEPLLLGTTQAREVQKYVRQHLGHGNWETDARLQVHGTKIMNSAREKAAEEEKQREKRKINMDQKAIGTGESPSKKAPMTSTQRSSSSTLPARTQKSESLDIPINTNQSLNSKVVGFASSKLVYLCNKLLSHPDEKSIIFYNHNNTAFFIAEALELLKLSFLIYANTLSVRQRAEYLAKFNTDTETKVLLMDLKQAGQGLHVAAASRVYIVSPIWDQAMESQAIKRAHRIGQTREVFVETLVLKGTFEEDLVRRRTERIRELEQDTVGQTQVQTEKSKRASTEAASQTPKGKGSSSTNAMLDDRIMVKVLKNIQFLTIADDDEKFGRLDTPVPLIRLDQPKSMSDGGPSGSIADKLSASQNGTTDTPLSSKASTSQGKTTTSSPSSIFGSGLVVGTPSKRAFQHITPDVPTTEDESSLPKRTRLGINTPDNA